MKFVILEDMSEAAAKRCVNRASIFHSMVVLSFLEKSVAIKHTQTRSNRERFGVKHGEMCSLNATHLRGRWLDLLLTQ